MSPRPEIAHYDPFSGPPRFNSAARVGVRPGTELIHPIAVTGARPFRYTVAGLPTGISVDEAGVLRGTAPTVAGTHCIDVEVANEKGTVKRVVELVVGDTLALTPPMGWNSWNIHATAVNSQVIIATARAIVETGMRDLGYRYVNIDDYWHATSRAPDGRPRANPDTFPDGIEAVADEVHSLGLSLGLYSDAADRTCAGCYGSYGYERIDAETYAAWGVDLLKYDYCYAPAARSAAVSRYRAMADALAGTDRSIVFSVCEWGIRKPWEWARDAGGNMWRTTPDIFDNFGWTPLGVRFIARRNLRLADHAGPGAWNDPDMLLVGNRGDGRATGVLRTPNQLPGLLAGRRIWSFTGLNDVQVHTHVSLWAMMAAPLLASHDLNASSDFDLALLRNPEILAIDQDPLGAQGRLVGADPKGGLSTVGGIDAGSSVRRRTGRSVGLWQVVKPLADGGFAVSVTNLLRTKRNVTVDLDELAACPHTPEPVAGAYDVVDAWTMESMGDRSIIRASLPGHGTRVWVRRPR